MYPETRSCASLLASGLLEFFSAPCLADERGNRLHGGGFKTGKQKPGADSLYPVQPCSGQRSVMGGPHYLASSMLTCGSNPHSQSAK